MKVHDLILALSKVDESLEVIIPGDVGQSYMPLDHIKIVQEESIKSFFNDHETDIKSAIVLRD